MNCSVCGKGKILPSKNKSNKPDTEHLRCMSPSCQAKFNKETKGNKTTIRRVA